MLPKTAPALVDSAVCSMHAEPVHCICMAITCVSQGQQHGLGRATATVIGGWPVARIEWRVRISRGRALGLRARCGVLEASSQSAPASPLPKRCWANRGHPPDLHSERSAICCEAPARIKTPPFPPFLNLSFRSSSHHTSKSLHFPFPRQSSFSLPPLYSFFAFLPFVPRPGVFC